MHKIFQRHRQFDFRRQIFTVRQIGERESSVVASSICSIDYAGIGGLARSTEKL
jgi:hypothetical protein